MIKYMVDEQYNNIKINHQISPINFRRKFRSIFLDILMLIISLIMVRGFKYINNITDVIIIIAIILVCSILPMINIRVNMRHKRFAIEMMTFDIRSVNNYLFIIPIMFISFGAPTTAYPYFLGVFLYSNIFNLLLHLSMNKPSFTEVNTYIDDKNTIVNTKSRLLGLSGKWTIKFPHNGRSLKFRIVTSKIIFGFTRTAFLSEDSYLKLSENPSSFIDKNVIYSIHFIRTQQTGKNIKINKLDRVYLIGKTRNSEEITLLISDLEKVTKIEYCLFSKK